jgi:hypothetical protein
MIWECPLGGEVRRAPKCLRESRLEGRREALPPPKKRKSGFSGEWDRVQSTVWFRPALWTREKEERCQKGGPWELIEVVYLRRGSRCLNGGSHLGEKGINSLIMDSTEPLGPPLQLTPIPTLEWLPFHLTYGTLINQLTLVSTQM